VDIVFLWALLAARGAEVLATRRWSSDGQAILITARCIHWMNVVNLEAKGISDDARDLGLQLTSYSWQPVP
jgi:hypothetical protein